MGVSLPARAGVALRRILFSPSRNDGFAQGRGWKGSGLEPVNEILHERLAFLEGPAELAVIGIDDLDAQHGVVSLEDFQEFPFFSGVRLSFDMVTLLFENPIESLGPIRRVKACRFRASAIPS
jgi:hypothetical protein